MTEPASSSAAFYRLHPAVVIHALWRVLKGWAVPLFLMLALGSGSEGPRPLLYLALVGAGLGVLNTVAISLSTRYGISEGRLIVRSGVLGRRHRAIPLERIQNVDLRQELFHRAFDVYEVRIETAGGQGESEAHLPALSFHRAEALRAAILGEGRHPTPQAPPAAIPLRVSNFEELLLAGATANRVGVIMAGLFGLFQLLGELGESAIAPIVSLVERLVGAGVQAQVILFGTGLVALLVAGWLLSVVLTMITYHHFELLWANKGLRRRHGLFNRFEGNVPIARIQVLHLERSFPRRRIRRVTLKADTAGSATEADMAGSVMLFPLLEDREVAELVRLVFPKLQLGGMRLQPVHRLSRRRGLIAYLRLAAGACAVIAAALSWTFALAAFAVLCIPCWLLARARYRTIGWHLGEDFLVAQHGLWLRRTSAVPLTKIQGVSITRSPFQRRLGLAHLTVATAGRGSQSSVTIPDLGLETAQHLFEHLNQATAHHAWVHRLDPV